MLTDAKIKTLTAGRHGDSEPTLYLVVAPTGRKKWIQRLTIYGRRTDLGLGPYPVVTIKDARMKAIDNRRKVYRGEDPRERAAPTVPTLADATRQYYDENKATWKDGRAADEWLDLLDRYVLPKCGSVPVNKLQPHHLLRALKPIWYTIHESARKAKGRVRTVLQWCQGHGFVSVNVAEQINGALPKLPAVKANMKAMPFKSMPTAWRDIAHAPTTRVARLCVMFLILTATRSQEAQKAEWSEVDFDSKVWTVPGSRMKIARDHRVPLSDEAVAILQAARACGHDRWVFPSPVENKPIASATMRKVIKDAGLSQATTLHGFRSTFRTWAGEVKAADHETLEHCLAHVVGNATSRAYARGDFLDRRQPVMQKWGVFVTGGRMRLIPHD